MPRSRKFSDRPFKKSPFKPTSRELDLLLLAGCSCMMTILFHPVAEALQSVQSMNSAASVSAQVRRVPTHWSSLSATLPAKREEIQDEEE
jgi:hypothetical protein